jgi:hypothetical protein
VITPDPEIIFDENIEIDEEGELNNLWEELQENGQAEGELADYLAVDQELITGGAMTIGEIVERCSSKETEEA